MLFYRIDLPGSAQVHQVQDEGGAYYAGNQGGDHYFFHKKILA
jgi:hypothetical protein